MARSRRTGAGGGNIVSAIKAVQAQTRRALMIAARYARASSGSRRARATTSKIVKIARGHGRRR